MKTSTNKKGFRSGTSGACEALLFEFSDESRGGVPQLHRVAATSLLEASAFLAKHEPGFRPLTVRELGVILLLSGSPYN